MTSAEPGGIVLTMNFWMVKQEPGGYSWGDFLHEGSTAWTGVRNFQARNNLRAMKRGDPVFFYHTGDEKQVVGLARVAKEAYDDPTGPKGEWSCVDIKAIKALKVPVSLGMIKADPILKVMALVKQSRLSVLPVTAPQAERLLELAQTKI